MRRSSSRRRIAVTVVAAVAVTGVFFSYFGIEAAKDMDISLYDSQVVSKDEQQTRYNAVIQFRNTSFVPLTVGDTTYNIKIDGESLGIGTIQPFVIGPYSTMLVNSEFTGNNSVVNRYGDEIPHERTQLTGTSSYNLYLTAFDVPINHIPTEDQVQKFTDE
ncbi:MAG: hypothetical protein ACE5KA_01945 [Nitrososphaerales archaeon]